MNQMDTISGPRLQVAIHNRAKGFPSVIWQAGAVFAFALLLYSRSLEMTFVGDSAAQFRWMESQSYASLFMAKAWIYRPLVFVLWKLILALTGRYDPFIYMLPNLLVHALNAVLVYLLARHFTGTNAVALMAGLLFASHPYHVQIAWVEVLFHPLMTFLVLLSFWLHTLANGHGKRSRLFLLGSYLALGLAFFAHESGVVGAILIVFYDVLFGRLTARSWRTWSLRVAPYIVATGAYFAWWWKLPVVAEFAPSPPSSWVEILMNILPFLQGLVYPVAPIASLLRDWLGLSRQVALLLIATPTLLGLSLVYSRSRMRNMFYLSLIWWTIGVTPPSLLLSSGYVESGSRLFYLAAVSSSLVWAGALLPLGHSVAKRLVFWGRAVRPPVATVFLLSLILVPSVVFTLDRVALFERGSRFIRQIGQSAAQESPQAKIIYVNLPNYLNREAPYPLGNFGMVLIHNYVSIRDVVRVNSGQERDVTAYVSKELIAEGVGSHPREDTLVWSYFTYGKSIAADEFLRNAILADQTFIFDPGDWQVKALDSFVASWPPVAFAQGVKARLQQRTQAYLSIQGWDASMQLSPRSAVKPFDGRKVLVLPENAQHDAIMVFTDIEDSTLTLLHSVYPEGRLSLQARYGGKPAVAFEVPAYVTPRVTPQHRLLSSLGNQVGLVGFDLDTKHYRPGDTIHLALYWRPLRKMKESYTVFTHVVGPLNPETGNPIWGQADMLPGAGSYPTNNWDKGEMIIDRYAIPLREDTPPGKYELEIGMYLLKTGKRLPVVVGDLNTETDRVLLATIDIWGR